MPSCSRCPHGFGLLLGRQALRAQQEGCSRGDMVSTQLNHKQLLAGKARRRAPVIGAVARMREQLVKSAATLRTVDLEARKRKFLQDMPNMHSAVTPGVLPIKLL